MMNALRYIEKALDLITVYRNISEPQDMASLIEKSENKLKIHYPSSYRNFLMKFGCFSFEGDEFYGLIDDDFENSGIPDVVWHNLGERKDGYVIDSVLMICFDGMGDYYSIDTTRVNEEGENPVIIWTPGLSKDPKDCEVVAESFGEFFYNRIKQSVESIESEK